MSEEKKDISLENDDIEEPEEARQPEEEKEVVSEEGAGKAEEEEGDKDDEQEVEKKEEIEKGEDEMSDNEVVELTDGGEEGKCEEEGEGEAEELKLSDAFEKINSKLDMLNESLEKLGADFNSKIRYDQKKEEIIDNLHREVQEYKNDLVKSLTRPIIMDVIHTIDDINKLTVEHKSKDPSELEPLKLIGQMEDISSDLEEILYRQGVDPFDSHLPAYDPKRQKVVKKEDTDDPSKDKTISKQVRKGYEWEGKVLRQEMVNVYVYKPGINVPEINKNNEEMKDHE